MDDSNFISTKKFYSDEEKTIGYKNYIKKNEEIIKNKFKEMAYPTDYPLSMTDGNLFAKFSIEYIKNIIFAKKNLKCKENIQFNFFYYIRLFTESKHTEEQKKIFEDIIGFKNQKAGKDEYLDLGDFDFVIDAINGSDILNALDKHKYNLYHYPGEKIKKDLKYCVICEIKSNYFKQIKDNNIQKQFKKYLIILQLLLSKPNLESIKEKIGLNGKNELIFMIATNGDYYQFDYMRYSRLNFKEDNNTDSEIKYKVPGYLKYIEEISKLNIPILLLFIPRTLDDNGTIYKNKYVTKMEKEIQSLWEVINKMKEELKKINKILNIEKENEKCDNTMLNKKRERNDTDHNK